MPATTEQIKEIERLYAKGTIFNEIYKKIGLSPSIIKKIVYASKNLTRRNKSEGKMGRPTKWIISPVSKEIESRIAHLYSWGYSPKEIADDIKVTPTKVVRTIEFLNEFNKVSIKIDQSWDR